MIIAFWSNLHGQPRTTSNMLAISTAIALEYNRKCLVTQTHFNMNSLEAYLLGDRENCKDVFMDIGLDGLTGVIKLRPLDKQTIENYSIPLMNNQLTLLPGTVGCNRELYTDDMIKTMPLVLNGIQQFYDMVFVDLNSGEDQISKLVLEKADIVVVNLSQNRNVMEHYLNSWKPINKRAVYLIGNYDRKSSYNLHNLKSMYRPLSKNKTAVIPYNSDFMDALSDGNVVRFMKKNYDIHRVAQNGYFMECVKEASRLLIKLENEVKGGKLQ